MTSLVSATFETRMAAEHALRELERIGVSDTQISIVVTDNTRGDHFVMEDHSKADEGFAGGATAGGLIGAVLGAVTTAGTLAIPGLNLVVTGAMVGALAGLATGATTGGLIGALIGAGFNEHEAKIYDEEVRRGSVLMAVKPIDDKQHDRIEEIFKNDDQAYNLAA
ncbi:MAG: hypothetical protein AB7E85_00760 [Pseudobdellovibrionaceae bacterium]